MNKIVQRFIIMIAASTLSGCPMTVNLNVSTDQPIALAIEKPIELKLGADIAVTKLPPVKADVKVTTLAPVKVGIAHSNTPNSTDKEK